MGCACGGASVTPAAGATSLRASGSDKWTVYRADGTVADFDSEPQARMEVTRTGGSMRKK
jgi:hypothetical protein